VSGSVEAACGLGLADAVVDLVETGTTMKVCLLRFSAKNTIELVYCKNNSMQYIV
jgi:ATP phosphoribosyltransferase